MELQVEYPQFTGRRYGVAIQNPHGKTIVPAESFFIGNFLASPIEVTRDRLEKWLEHEKQVRDTKRLFDVSKKYRLKIREGGEIHERVRRLIELSRSKLELALSYKIKTMEGSHNLLRIGGREAFDLNINDKKNVDIHAGNVILTGFVKSKSPGNKPQKTKYKRVSITGPFKQSKLKFTNISCICEDSGYGEDKEGYEYVNLLCTHAGALLYFAHQNPDIIERFQHVRELMRKEMEEDIEIFIPFHSDISQEKPNLEWMIECEQPSLDNLVIDVVLDRYFNREKLFEIGKKLTMIPMIYDSSLESLILDGKAGFEVLINSNVFDTAKRLNPAVRSLFNLMKGYLENKGYKMAGYCLEKKDSPYETIALMFKGDKNEVRLLFNESFPPVVIVRKDKSEPVKVHRYIPPNAHQHPFSELFTPKVFFDDRTRSDTLYEVIIPNEFRIPKALYPDYKISIIRYFPGGIEGFKQQIDRKKIKNKNNLLAIVN